MLVPGFDKGRPLNAGIERVGTGLDEDVRTSFRMETLIQVNKADAR
jgi:hypothetical protein